MFLVYTRTFQEVSINSLLEVKRCPKTTCWKVLVGRSRFVFVGTLRKVVEFTAVFWCVMQKPAATDRARKPSSLRRSNS